MHLLKPPPAVRLNPAHPLARGLAACWLLNEGAGDTAHDSAGGQAAVGNPAPAWGPGRCDFNGVDQVFFGDMALDLEQDFSVVAAVRTDPLSGQEAEYAAVGMGDPTHACRFVLGLYGSTGKYRCHLREDDNTNVVNVWNFGAALDDGRPHQLAFSFAPSAGAYYCLVDGVALSTAAPSPYTAIHASKVSLGSKYYLGGLSTYWPGSIDYVYAYRRALSPGEIARLYRDPYAMFERSAAPAAALLTGPVYDLGGSVEADAACTALARVTRRLAGTSAANSQTSASLTQANVVTLSGSAAAGSSLLGSAQVLSARSEPQAAWLGDALFNGMTARAFKLGTELTRGWFWMRRQECSAIYRGPTIGEVDFNSILCVVDRHATQVRLPTCLDHEPGSTHCYVVRRFNSCGHQEHSTGATVTVAIGPDGTLTAPAPNSVFGLTARRAGGDRIRLRWFYCPLDQQVAPQAFNVYGDCGTGRLDPETPLATVAYEGRRLYTWQTDLLAPGRYTFAVRPESIAGSESPMHVTVSCEVGGIRPEAPTILAAEVTP